MVKVSVRAETGPWRRGWRGAGGRGEAPECDAPTCYEKMEKGNAQKMAMISRKRGNKHATVYVIS